MPPVRSHANVRDDFTYDPDGDVQLILPAISKQGKDINSQGKRQENARALPYPSTSSAETEIIMLVSSKHMALISPVFKAMLSPGFQEGEDLRLHGNVQIRLPEDDPDALSILLNIIHNRNRRVPGTLVLKQLMGIAVLLDKYQISEEIISCFVDRWVRTVISHFLQTVSNATFAKVLPDLIRLLSICWSFKHNGFQEISLIGALMCTSDEKVRLKHSDMPDIIPLPEKVLTAIEALRHQLIGGLISKMRALVNPYYGDDGGCVCRKTKCFTLMLGNLLRSFSVKGRSIYDQSPPFPALSVDLLDDIISKTEITKLCVSNQLTTESFHEWFAKDRKARKGINIATLL